LISLTIRPPCSTRSTQLSCNAKRTRASRSAWKKVSSWHHLYKNGATNIWVWRGNTFQKLISMNLSFQKELSPNPLASQWNLE